MINLYGLPLHKLEDFQGAIHLLLGMNCRRNDAQHNLTLRHHGINDNGAENAMIFTQIDDSVASLVDIAREENRGDGRLCDTGVEAFLFQLLQQILCGCLSSSYEAVHQLPLPSS